MDNTLDIASKIQHKPVFIASASALVPEKLPNGVEAKMIWGSSLKNNEVGPAIFEHFLPKTLARGSFVVAPEPWMIGTGLESVQIGLDALKKGVSAKKVVIVR